MADESMASIDRLKQQGGGDFLRFLEETVLAALVECEVSNRIGADLHERNGERRTYRNGYRDRVLHSRLGALELQVPRLRQGSYFPSVVGACPSRRDPGSVDRRRLHPQGRRPDAAMGMTGISKSQVSERRKAIDERVDSFLTRPIEGEWPYL